MYAKDDPLLSLSNTSMNYNIIQPTTTLPLASATNVISSTTNEFPTLATSMTSNYIEPTTMVAPTVVYQITTTNNEIYSSPMTVSSPDHQPIHTTSYVNQVTPVQLISHGVHPSITANVVHAQPQKYRKILEKNTNQIVTTSVKETKPIIIGHPTTVVYATANTRKPNIQLLDGTTILATHVPTMMVEQENQRQNEMSTMSHRKPKEGKKTTHNAIERRYRTSINDKIVELKNILVGETGKLNKSAILKQSIDKIHDLEDENYELKMENARLREWFSNKMNGDPTADSSTLKVLLMQKTTNRQPKRRYTNSSNGGYSSGAERMTPPPTSDESNPSYSPAHSDNVSMPGSPLAEDEISQSFNESEPPAAKRARSSRGMTTHSKLALCAFMFAVITLNPLASFLNGRTSDTEDILSKPFGPPQSRNILKFDLSSNMFSSLWQDFSVSALVFAINCLVIIGCLVKLFVFGDPVMRSKSSMATEYAKQKAIADSEFSRGRASEAYRAYTKCLRTFEITLPESRFGLASMISWQFVRSCLHRIQVGQWLTSKCAKLFRSTEAHIDAMNSAREIAITLNRCNQIHFSQNMRSGLGLVLSMYAVNMAETSSNISPDNLIDIYLTAALRCRRHFPPFFSWICSRYYLHKAKSVASTNCDRTFPLKFNWIFSNIYGYKFICKYSFENVSSDEKINDDSMFSYTVNDIDPLENLYKVSLRSFVVENSSIKLTFCAYFRIIVSIC